MGCRQSPVKELMMRVFVAGATGAIGKQLVPRLVAAGHEVHGMTRNASNEAMLDALGAVPVVADALDPHQVADAAEATVAAIEHGRRGVYNVVDDDPAPVAEWLPTLARQLRAKKPRHVPRIVGRLFAGEAGVVMMTELRGASNGKAKRELVWRPAHPSWRQGLAAA
jgi:nucleoside-diphosphate-sugar epimerase